jgi:hypothetical protein
MKKDVYLLVDENDEVISAFFNKDACAIAVKSTGATIVKFLEGEDLSDYIIEAIEIVDNYMFDSNISRAEIFDVLESGFKVAHTSFLDDEWVCFNPETLNYFTEDGCNMGHLFDEFWTIRSGGNWENGWRVWYAK